VRNWCQKVGQVRLHNNRIFESFDAVDESSQTNQRLTTLKVSAAHGREGTKGRARGIPEALSRS